MHDGCNSLCAKLAVPRRSEVRLAWPAAAGRFQRLKDAAWLATPIAGLSTYAFSIIKDAGFDNRPFGFTYVF
jgi:hypothetical protein